MWRQAGGQQLRPEAGCGVNAAIESIDVEVDVDRKEKVDVDLNVVLVRGVSKRNARKMDV